MRSIFYAPNGGLCPIFHSDLAKNRLDVGLHGFLGDIHRARNAFVGGAFGDAAQNYFLPRKISNSSMSI